jgi:hypothetical protein
MTQADDNAGASGTADDGQNNDDQPQLTSLDDVHARAQAQYEEEDATGDDEAGGDDNADEDGAGDAGDGGDDDKSEGAGSDGQDADDDAGSGDGGDDEADDDEAGAGDDTPEYQPGSAQIPKAGAADDDKAPEAPEVDDDVTKPGKYKAEFTDVDGNKYYVTDASQLPEDFEARSQRDYALAIQDLTKKQGEFSKDQSAYQEAKTQYDTKQSVGKLQDSWHQDIDRMASEKILPEKKEERDKVVAGVYGLMEAEMKKGRVIDSFELAHELYQGRIARAEAERAAADADKASKDDRKRRGGKVMGGGARSGAGGSSSGTDNRGRVLEGVRPGTSLDDVHARVMEEIK